MYLLFVEAAGQRDVYENGSPAPPGRAAFPYFSAMVVFTPSLTVASSNQRAVTVFVCV